MRSLHGCRLSPKLCELLVADEGASRREQIRSPALAPQSVVVDLYIARNGSLDRTELAEHHIHIPRLFTVLAQSIVGLLRAVRDIRYMSESEGPSVSFDGMHVTEQRRQHGRIAAAGRTEQTAILGNKHLCGLDKIVEFADGGFRELRQDVQLGAGRRGAGGRRPRGGGGRGGGRGLRN